MKATVATQESWSERVQAWRASGESARDFARKQGISPSSLYHWAKRVEHKPSPRFLKLVPRSSTPLPAAEMVVELGLARVRVTRGFDAELLAELVKTLSAGGR